MAKSDVMEVEEGGKKRRFRIIETPVDPPLTVKRTLVPIDTTEDDIPVGSRLLDERETDGQLARSTKPERFIVGEPVRRAVAIGEEQSEITGTIDARLVSGKLRVRWSDGSVSRHEPKELTHIW